MSNSKLEATFHPEPAPSWVCPECEKTWGNADAAKACECDRIETPGGWVNGDSHP